MYKIYINVLYVLNNIIYALWAKKYIYNKIIYDLKAEVVQSAQVKWKQMLQSF